MIQWDRTDSVILWVEAGAHGQSHLSRGTVGFETGYIRF